jgi:TRAP-type C4-dicarboxylate transport system permease small subunit
MAEQMLQLLRRINRVTAILTGLGLLGCAAFVLLDILLRQAGSSFGGTDEISGYAMAIASAWGMGFTLLELGHVRIDFLRVRTGQLARVLFDLFSMLILSATVTLIAVKCWPVLEKSLRNLSTANTPLETPLWWVQLPWMAGWVWFALMSWLTFLAALALFAARRHDEVEKAIGAMGEAESVK